MPSSRQAQHNDAFNHRPLRGLDLRRYAAPAGHGSLHVPVQMNMQTVAKKLAQKAFVLNGYEEFTSRSPSSAAEFGGCAVG